MTYQVVSEEEIAEERRIIIDTIEMKKHRAFCLLSECLHELQVLDHEQYSNYHFKESILSLGLSLLKI